MDDRAHNGVRLGQVVRDVEGKDLGRVQAFYERTFLVVRGPPLLFRRDSVIRYEEVRGERDGAVVVARSDDELLEHARGELPATWRVPVPHGFPSAATPGEARGVFEEVALGHAVTGAAAWPALADLEAAGEPVEERAASEASPRRVTERGLDAPPPGA